MTKNEFCEKVVEYITQTGMPLAMNANRILHLAEQAGVQFDIELLPCAHCGAKGVIGECVGTPHTTFLIQCPNKSCTERMGWFNSKQEAIAAWNRRM